MSFSDSTKAVWIVVALLLPIFTSLVQVESAPCDNYTVQPPDPPVLYAIQGRNATIEAFVQGRTLKVFNGTDSQQSIRCGTGSIMCHLDQDSGILTFINFKPMYAGEYELQFVKTLTDICTYRFNLTEAMPPTLTDNDSTKTINADSGPLTFSPIIFPGVPPGEVRWYKDGVNISVGNTFTLSKVMASDRGVYTAKISNPFAGSANVTYTLLVNFPPIITITATEVGPQDYKIKCTAIAYPRIDTIKLMEDRNGVRTSVHGSITKSSTVSDTFDFEALVEYSGSNNCPVVYYCFVNTSFHDRTESNGTCQTTPNVTNFRINETGSTNTTAYLTWTLEPENILVSEYSMEYRKTGSNDWILDDDTCQPSTKYCIIPSLDPGTLYEFRLVARNSVGTGAVSGIQSYHTRSAPKNKPIGVAAERTTYNDNYDTIRLSWQDVPALSYADVSGYQIVFYTDTNRTEGYINDIASPQYLFDKMINRSHTYFFKVRANNTWGLGPHSALIESMKTNVDDPYQGQISVTTTLEVSDDTVVVSWVLRGESHITSIGITIDEITIETSSSSTTVTTRRIYNYNVNGVRSSRKCFSGLDSSNRYKFCVVATSRTGLNKSDCVTVSTTSSSMNINDATDCQNIQPVSSGPAIPAWSIGVIVAGAVLLVFVFGGCGLYYGIKRNKKGGADFDSPHPSVDDINNGPYPAKRVPSPSRSCMSYRHNQQHQHGLEWRTTNPLGRQDSIPGVTSV